MSVPKKQLALALVAVLSAPPPSFAGGAGPLLLTAPQSGPALDQTYAGEGFTLRYPQAYTVRPFTGGLALVQAGRGDVLTAAVLARPGNARHLTAEAYARQFAPLNIQGGGALISFFPFRLAGGTVAYRGTWRASGGVSPVLGPLYLVPLGPEAQRWLVLSAADTTHLPLLHAVAHQITLDP